MNTSYTHAATVYSSRPYACYSFAIICLFLLAIPTFAQKVKKEVILYKNANAVAVGYTCKGQFVDSSKITIYHLPSSANYRKKERDGKIYFKSKHGERSLSSLNVIADGIYNEANGKVYLNGKYHPEPYVTYEGTFSFCNSLDGISVIADAKKARQFKFEFTDVYYCHVQNARNWEMYIEKMEDRYSIRTIFFNSDNIIESLKGSVPLRAVTSEALHYNKIFNLLSKINHAEVTFKNGDSFVGNLKVEAQGGAFGNWKISWSGLSGNYKYATGETFEGVWQPISINYKSNISIPTRGVMTFKDGKSAKGNWLSDFTFEPSEWEEIFNGNRGPTDLRDKALALKAKKEAELREKREREQAEKRAKEQAKLRKEAHKRYLINKYGIATGTLLAKREIRLGMTKEMVNEVWNRQIYDIAQSVLYGQNVEVWTLNQDKLSLYIAANEGKDGMMVYLFALNLGVPLDIPSILVFTNGKLSNVSE